MTIRQVHKELLKLNPPQEYLHLVQRIIKYAGNKNNTIMFEVLFYNKKDEMQVIECLDLNDLYNKASEMLLSYGQLTNAQRSTGAGDVKSEGSNTSTSQGESKDSVNP